MNVDLQSNELRRIDDLWFHDGNIVLQAGSAQYRVFRSMLASRSSVFKDMFSFPQPPDSELVDGCPLVLLPETEAEVTPFLKAIFDSQFFLPFPARTNFETIAGCLRLSHKYGADYLRRRALVHLTSVFRTTFEEWTGSGYQDENSDRTPSSITSWPPPENKAYLVLAIQLAREVEALWILPTAFYSLTFRFENVGRDIFHHVTFCGIQASLSVEDQCNVATASGEQAAMTADVLAFLSSPQEIEDCESPYICILERLKAVETCRVHVRQLLRNPLDAWTSDDFNDFLEEICSSCLRTLKQTHREALLAVWNRLPQVYGLPSWDKLEEMKTAAIGTDLLF